ncbi:MAG: UDP-2,3-diacylglucosamine diphosphatase [Xanthomonadaceae bacterium]|nr:UDP-2,3-diacylglucosamine diphosphatase [Xanthomonadaceae bacterium]
MPTLFISDLHLDESRPRLIAAFEEFLAGDARAAQALYILGDLFESYIGDDDDAPLNARVARATRKLRDTGVPVFFMHGNRDFLLGQDFAARAEMTLLDDPAVIELGGEPVLLMHGDTLCTDDTAYLKFRTLVRDPAWQRAFLSKPLAERRAFAAQARGESRKHTANAKPEIMDVNQAAVETAMRAHGVRRLIHGHTHRPATHHFDVDGRKAERIVLGDWYEQASVLQLR